jgi:tRNA(Ile)-lysidine synthase
MAAAPSPDLVLRLRGEIEALAKGADRFAVAVSGGPDSLALLLLVRAAFPGRVHAATVDHGLRPASGDEAAAVARLCERLGVPHQILAVQVERAGEGLQAAAREARYAALAGWMIEEGLSVLLTAHHGDDQAETLLMRLNRGSGVAGLAGVRATGPVPYGAAGLRLCRPLLGWRRAELEAVVAEAGVESAQDPSNGDERFDRARLRRQMAEAPWLDSVALARSAALLGEAESALQWTAAQLFEARVETGERRAVLDPRGLPPELLRRLVLACLRVVAPGATPRGDQLAALVAKLQSGGTGTLCGAKATGGESWRFEPAPPRRG